VNQPHGFDCPGCAWPDPSHRTPFEFCENGAKAVAEEATTLRVTPDFFRQWSLTQLAARTDHWLGKQGRLTHPMVLREGQLGALLGRPPSAALRSSPHPQHGLYPPIRS
jgi:anaerobic selenocysteine-containing dehydrogenase